MWNNLTKRLVGFFGVASAITGLASWNPDFSSVGTILGLIALSGIITYSLYEYIRQKTKGLSPFGCCGIPGFGVRMATADDLPKICELQQYFYDKDAVPLDTYKKWFQQNPDGFFVLQKTTFNEDNSITKELVGIS